MLLIPAALFLAALALLIYDNAVLVKHIRLLRESTDELDSATRDLKVAQAELERSLARSRRLHGRSGNREKNDSGVLRR